MLPFPQTDTARVKLLVAITFHFRRERLRYLFEVLRALSEFMVAGLEVRIVTNAQDAAEIARLDALCRTLFHGDAVYAIDQHELRVNPYELTWCHKPLITGRFMDAAAGFTHFAYLEDDIRFTYGNFQYWLAFREPLRPRGLLPAFVQIEYRAATDQVIAKDAFSSNDDGRRRVPVGPYVFMPMDNPYNALFILDRALAAEYVASVWFDRWESERRHDWWIAERAAMGLCFEAVPEGFASRYVVGVWPLPKIPMTSAWLHHLPNNYADGDPGEHQLGRIGIRELFT